MSTVELLLIIKNFVKKRGELLLLAFVLVISGIILYSYFSSGDKNSRDMERYADLLSINDGLKVFYAKNNTLPLPEEYVNLVSNGDILTYQGYFGEETQIETGLKNIKDPLGDKIFKYLNYYTYVTDQFRQKFQLMAWYENDGDMTYTPSSKRLPYLYGEDIGVVIENKSNRPIQETKLGVDVLNSTDSYSIYINDKNILTGDKSNLKNYLANTIISKSKSCLNIKQSGWNTSGYYYINPLEGTAYGKISKPFKVYCDMESDGGGWIRLYYKDGAETCFNDENKFNSFMLEKLLTKDFAVSDNKETLQSEGSWILKNIDLNYTNFSFVKLANVSNCKTPIGTNWSLEYGNQFQFYHEENGELIRRLDDNSGLLGINGQLYTLGTWKSMFHGCNSYRNIGDKLHFQIGGYEKHTGWFIHGRCADYTSESNSITSRWNWNDTKVIWVR